MSILILAEHDGAQLKRATRQAISAAQHFNAPIDLLIVGHKLNAISDEARSIAGVSRVLSADAAHLANHLAEDVAALISSIGESYSVILAAHSVFSRNILPRAAAVLDVSMLSDVVELIADNTYVRPIYAGNLLATIKNEDAIQVLTIRASRFAVAQDAADAAQAQVVEMAVPPPYSKVRKLGVQQSSKEGPELGTARVVVSGGRSLGSAERFNTILAPLADTLGAALGATRAAVDAGYAPNEIQVGQTGTIVAPDFYLAIGVSGAIQHTAGMKDSRIVVAINQDPEAPIFDVADYGLVGDLFETVPALTEALRRELH